MAARARARSRSRTTTSSARRSSWSPGWTRSRRCRSCICVCARPPGAARRSTSCIPGAPACGTWRNTSCAARARKQGCAMQPATTRDQPEVDSVRAGGERRHARRSAAGRRREPGVAVAAGARGRDRGAVRVRHPPGERSRGARGGRASRPPARRPAVRRSPTSGPRSRTLWGPIIVGDEGRNWWGILEACAERDIDVLFLVGVDPLRDFPDAALAMRALQNVGSHGRAVARARARWSRSRTRSFLPPRSWRRTGTSRRGRGGTSGSGRSAARRASRSRTGRSSPSLALAAGGDLGFETLDELHEEMGRLLAPREPRERR